MNCKQCQKQLDSFAYFTGSDICKDCQDKNIKKEKKRQGVA